MRLRKDLGVYQRYIEDLELRDYRVRVFQGGTDAVTRVLIEFGDATRRAWSTVGVSGNIIDASFQALVDAIAYRLLEGGRRGAVSGPSRRRKPLADLALALKRKREFERGEERA